MDYAVLVLDSRPFAEKKSPANRIHFKCRFPKTTFGSIMIFHRKHLYVEGLHRDQKNNGQSSREQ